MPFHEIARALRNRISILITVAIWVSLGWNDLARAQDALPGEETSRAASSPTQETAVASLASPAELPDAPVPELASAPDGFGEPPVSFQPTFEPYLSAADPSSFGVTPNPERVPLSECPYDKTRAKECRIHWAPLIISSAAFNALLNAGNLYTGYWYRWETTHGKWFQRWFDSDLGWNWNHWVDGNPKMDQYVGHPMMGSITNYLWIQNDPKGTTVEIGEPGYWKRDMRALLFTTIYHFEWKFGPFGEAGVGHIGDHPTHYVNGEPRNDTGIVELVTTPVGGLVWTIAEDSLDKYVVKRIEETPRGPFTLLFLSFLTPSRATANIFRWRPPWYRDSRVVKAKTFWGAPSGAEEASAESGEDTTTGGGTAGTRSSGGVQPARHPEVLPIWPHPGGVHEFGVWWGLSLVSGHIWGYASDIKYMPIDLNYSYLWIQKTNWNFRYAPELTAMAMLDEPVPTGTDRFSLRKRTYGSGISPVGFKASFLPERRVQPFLSTDGGFIYFMDRVLSPEGSQFMYTIDFGGGLQIHFHNRQAISFGYRYQHLSNANISHHNPGTDTNLFYFAVSRFRTKGYR